MSGVKTFFSHNWDSSCVDGGANNTFLTPLIDEGFMASVPNDPSQKEFALFCYLYSSTNGSGVHENGLYYLISSLEPTTAVGEKSCPGIGPYPFMICLSGGAS